MALLGRETCTVESIPTTPTLALDLPVVDPSKPAPAPCKTSMPAAAGAGAAANLAISLMRPPWSSIKHSSSGALRPAPPSPAGGGQRQRSNVVKYWVQYDGTQNQCLPILTIHPRLLDAQRSRRIVPLSPTAAGHDSNEAQHSRVCGIYKVTMTEAFSKKLCAHNTSKYTVL